MTADPTSDRPSEPFRRPEGRYGSSERRMPRFLPAALVAVGVLAVVPLTISVYDGFDPDVGAEVVGWTLESEFEVAVRVQVDKPAGQDASCAVHAFDVSGEVVGSAQVELTGDRTSGVVERTFPTSVEAVAVDTGTCTTDG